MRIQSVTFLAAGATMLMLSGCTPSGSRCFPYMQKAGYFCYKGYNFGRNVSRIYKKGVVDGCRTGEGYFQRNYSLSAISAEYRRGWDAGRARCPLILPEEARAGMRTQYQQAIDEQKQ